MSKAHVADSHDLIRVQGARQNNLKDVSLVDAMQPHIRAFVERAVTFTTCPECGGTRLNEAARSSKIGKINIAGACAMQINELAEWTRGLKAPAVAPLLAKLQQTLDSFIQRMNDLLLRLRDKGNTVLGKSVLVIGHHQPVMAHADWLIDLGPGAGHDGGRIVFQGTPADLVAAKSTLTGQHLAAFASHKSQRRSQ